MDQRTKKLIPSDPKDISSAYLSINAYTYPLPDNFETLYANKFVEEDPTPMAEDLKSLFNNDAIKLNNPNLREQIGRIMEQYDSESGPWYVDGDDSVLHIHNGNPGPDSGFVFKYQEEYGEVLKVRIHRKEVYGGQAAKAQELPDYNREQTQIVIEPPVIRESHGSNIPFVIVNSKNINPADNIPGYAGYSGGFNPYEGRFKEGYQTPMGFNPVNDKINDEYRAKLISSMSPLTAEADKAQKNKVQPVDPRTLIGGLRRMYTDQKYAESVKRTIEEGLNWNERYNNKNEYIKLDALNKQKVLDNPDPIIVKNMTEQLENMGKSAKPAHSWALHDTWEGYRQEGEATLEPGQKEWLSSTQMTRVIDTPGQFFTTHYKPTTLQYASALNSITSQSFNANEIGGVTVPIALGTESKVSPVVVANKLSKATGQTYSPDSGKVLALTSDLQAQRDKWTKQGYNVAGLTLKANTGPDAQFNPYIIVPDIRKTEQKMPVTALNCMDTIVRASKQPQLHSAFSAAMASMNAMSNKLRRARHKELEVELLLVGRPALKAGIVITLLGIGKRYSGKWYVKTCIHQMDKSGYTCSLTLQKNQLTANNGKVGGSSSRKDSNSNIKSTKQDPTNINKMSRADKVLVMSEMNYLGTVKGTKQEDPNITDKKTLGLAGVYANAKKGGTTAIWTKDGVQINAEVYQKNRQAQAELRKKKLEAQNAAAQAAGKLKAIRKKKVL